MIWAFFVFGSVWFWTLGLFWLIVLTALVEKEEAAYSFWSVVIFFVLIHLFGNTNFFVYMKDHPWDFVRIIILYSIIGIAWGAARFWFCKSKTRRLLDELKITFYEWYKDDKACATWVERTFRLSHGDDKRTVDQLKDDWDPIVGKKDSWRMFYEGKLNRKELRWVGFESQAGTVIFWMAYWPVSAFWTILDDPLRRAATWVYDHCLVGIFKKIHDKTVGKALEIE